MVARFLAVSILGVAGIRLKQDGTHPAFDLVSVNTVEEQGTNFTLYKHKATGAEVLSATNSDENKVFSIGFRTPVSDSTGVAHILEHSVLCGSAKYPVKEPFVHLLRTSMQTYLNAFTYPERTVYPVASQNLKDFHNLIGVYLDAVLHPRCVKDPQVLEQEGWHYEIANADAPIEYKGIVYNEMKGVYGSPESRIHEASKRNLFPNSTYRFNSGGDPNEIPNLTFEGFKAFYDKHYHPSNSRIFFYGNDPVEERLNLLDDYLKEYGAAKEPVESTRVETQPLWSKPRRIVERFPAAAKEVEAGAKHHLNVHWLLNEEPMAESEQFALGIVSYLLLGTSSSTLHKALMDAELGDTVTGGGFSDSLKQATFAVGLKGVVPEKVSQVEALIQDTLKHVVSTGFDKGAVEAALNTFDFSLREFSSASTNRGISFMNAIYKHWIFERDPLRDLRFEKPMQDLRAELQKPKQRYLQGLVEKYLLDNPHRLTVEGVPAVGMAEAEEAAEKAKLQATKSSFDRATLEKLAARAKELQVAQEAKDSPEAVATLPTLSLSDLDSKSKDLDISVGEMHGATYLTHNVASSGIVYFDVVFDATAVALEDLPLLPLFQYMLFKTGTSNMDRTAFEQKMGTVTGGLSSSTMNMVKTASDGSVGDLDDILFKVMVHGKARAAQAPQMLDLLHAALTDSKLDSQDRALEYLKSTKTGYEGAFKSSGNAFANQRIYARRSLSGYIDEITGGLEYYNSLKQQIHEAEHEWPALLARFERIRKTLLNRDGAVVNVAADLETLSSVRGAIESFVLRIPARGSDLLGWGRNLTNVSLGPRQALRELMHQELELRLPPREEGFVVPTQVNFVAQGGGLFKFGERVAGHDQVIVRYLSNSYMWDNVRVMGGAYGGSCSISPVSGTFMCSSYRDPNLENTLKVFNGVDKFLESVNLDEKEIEPLIIGAVADLDKPMAPSTQGRVSMIRHLSGQTLEARQKRRDEMLRTNLQDFRHFAKQLEEHETSFKACIFGSEAAFTKANAALPEGKRLNLTNLL